MLSWRSPRMIELLCLVLLSARAGALFAPPLRSSRADTTSIMRGVGGGGGSRSAATTASDQVKLRSLLPSDLDAVALLCAEAFAFEDLDWWQVVEKNAAVGDYRRALGKRLLEPPSSPSASNASSPPQPQHVMVVAESAGDVVGFVEVGMLPPPPGWAPDAAGVDDGDGDSLFGGGEGADRLEVPGAGADGADDDLPYLGNLVVAASARRRGVATSLVRFGEAYATRRLACGALCASVAPTNADAQVCRARICASAA